MEKQYLGDGVYLEPNHFGGVDLTTENGVDVTNLIVLEPEVAKKLVETLAQIGIKAD